MIDDGFKKRAFVAAALAAAYFAAGKLGLLLAFYNASASAVWPPTGLSLAALLILGRGYWPAIAAGAFLVNISTQGSIPTCAAIAAGNAFEAWLGAWGVERFARGRACLQSSSTLFLYALIILLTALVSATIGVMSLTLGANVAWKEFPMVWLTWWLGDATSALIFGPAVLLTFQHSWRKVDLTFQMERLAAFSILSLACLAVFGGYFFTNSKSLPVALISWPVLLWIAFRLGQRETAYANLGLALFAVWGTLNGWGPFAGDSANSSLILLQTYLGLASVSSVSFAALTAEREAAAGEVARFNHELEDRVRQRSHALMSKNEELRQEVAERRAAEEALARQSRTLARSNTELEMFASIVSHDLKEPLRKITAFADLIDRKAHRALGAEASLYLQRMKAAAARMQTLIQDLLDFSKATIKTAPFQTLALGDVIQEVLSDLEVAIETARARIEIGELPTIVGDRTQIKQLFQNLLGNAFKFGRPGRAPRVRIELENLDDRQAWISVTDDGIGFPQESEDEMFRPFHRLGTPDRYGGTGMGLAICRKIVRRHGGTIAAFGDSAKGSRFIVSLPLAARGQEAEYAQTTFG